ncbi:peptide-methionine (R)-S-oxide reductase MsrB [Planctomycetaceae bacterium SH139]
MLTRKIYHTTLFCLPLLIAGALVWSPTGWGQDSEDQSSEKKPPTAEKAEKDEYKPPTKAELRRRLSRIQYLVTQEEETEPAFRNAYWDNKKPGTYVCIVCDKPLFTSETKFASGTGWPSFWQPLDDEAVGTKTDWKMFYPRTEVHCSRCRAHLGHVFEDGPRPTGLRYCMNSASMKFIEQEKDAAQEKTPNKRKGRGNPEASDPTTK